MTDEMSRLIAGSLEGALSPVELYALAAYYRQCAMVAADESTAAAWTAGHQPGMTEHDFLASAAAAEAAGDYKFRFGSN